MKTLRDIAQLIDHSLLHPSMTDDEVVKGCELAAKYEVATVCVKPYSIPLVKQVLKGSPVAICSVVGFPHGNSMTMIKLRETQDALLAGASEIDMVINVGKAKSGAYDYVKEEVRAINRACQRHNAPLKVIFENDFLSDPEIIELCKVMNDVNPAYVKTSTGYGFVKQPEAAPLRAERGGGEVPVPVRPADGAYSYKGATEPQVKLMRQHAAPHIRIKAAGGIRTLDQLLKFRELGCSRIGTTATAEILEEAKKRPNFL